MVNITGIRNSVRTIIDGYGSPITIFKVPISLNKWGDNTGIIADFNGTLNGFSAGCGGNPETEYSTGHDGKGQSIHLYPTTADWLACLSKDIGNVTANEEIYLYAKGTRLYAQIYNGSENGNNSTCHRYDSATNTWSANLGYHEQTTWALYKLTIQRTVTITNNKLYLYSQGEGSESWFDDVFKGGGVTTSVGIPYDIMVDKFNFQPVGDIGDGDLILLVKDSEDVFIQDSEKYMYITYKTIDYDVVSFEKFMLKDVTIAKQLVLKRRD
jgi:hypothetical protein